MGVRQSSSMVTGGSEEYIDSLVYDRVRDVRGRRGSRHQREWCRVRQNRSKVNKHVNKPSVASSPWSRRSSCCSYGLCMALCSSTVFGHSYAATWTSPIQSRLLQRNGSDLSGATSLGWKTQSGPCFRPFFVWSAPSQISSAPARHTSNHDSLLRQTAVYSLSLCTVVSACAVHIRNLTIGTTPPPRWASHLHRHPRRVLL